MIGLAIELNTNCKSCGNPLPMNALTENVECSICQKTADFSYDFWKSMILDDAISKGVDLPEGQGTDQQNMTGEYTFHLIYGKQKPKCVKCKSILDDTKFEEYSKTGSIVCTCGANISVRATPPELIKLFDGVNYIIGENADMIYSGKSALQTPNAGKPLLFTCPSCAGNLEIDGTSRTVICKYCNSEIYLPDDLWLKLHPVKTIDRWYLAFDEKILSQRLPKWEYISDLIIDKDGNAYFMSTVDSVRNSMVWSMSKDFKPRWTTKTENYSYDDSGLAVSPDGILYVFNKRKNSLLKISCSDGSVLGNIKVKRSDDDKREDISGCNDMIIDSDGTLMCLINDAIARFNTDGVNIPVWSGTKHDGSFFSKVSKIINSIDGSGENAPPSVYELKDKPIRLDTEDVFIKLGLDGYIYIMDQNQSEGAGIVRYDHTGKKDWSAAIPLGYRSDKQHIDSDGNVFIVGDTDDDDHKILKYNRAADKWETYAKEISKGGVLCGEGLFAISNDGKLFVSDSDNCLKVLDQNLKKLYISSASKENDQDERDDMKDDNDDKD